MRNLIFILTCLITPVFAQEQTGKEQPETKEHFIEGTFKKQLYPIIKNSSYRLLFTNFYFHPSVVESTDPNSHTITVLVSSKIGSHSIFGWTHSLTFLLSKNKKKTTLITKVELQDRFIFLPSPLRDQVFSLGVDGSLVSHKRSEELATGTTIQVEDSKPLILELPDFTEPNPEKQ